MFSMVLISAIYTVPAPLLAQETSIEVLPKTHRVPAGTVIELEFSQTLSSKSNTTGQLFPLRLREPIMIDGQIVVPVGAIGGGEVLDASRAGMGGKSGKLIVSGRFVEVQGQRVRIRGLQGVLAGTDNSRAATTIVLIPYVGILGGFIQGGDVEIASGTAARAQLAADLVVTVPMQSTQTETQSSPIPSSIPK
jgi:hypothetical protein